MIVMLSRLSHCHAETCHVSRDKHHLPITAHPDPAMDLAAAARALVLGLMVGVREEEAEVEHQQEDHSGGEAERGHDQPLLEFHD